MPYPRQFPAPGTRDGARRQEKMTAVARYPDSTKTSLEQRLRARAREHWPQITSLHIRHRGNFSYVDATVADGTTLKLCRAALRRLGQPVAVRDLPRQERRLRRIGLPCRPARRHLPRRPRHRLRACVGDRGIRRADVSYALIFGSFCQAALGSYTLFDHTVGCIWYASGRAAGDGLYCCLDWFGYVTMRVGRDPARREGAGDRHRIRRA